MEISGLGLNILWKLIVLVKIKLSKHKRLQSVYVLHRFLIILYVHTQIENQSNPRCKIA